VIEDTAHMTIKLSRLGILEVESLYNRSKPSETAPRDEAPQKDKDSYTQNEKRKAKERRIAFQSMGEILSMKNDGAEILPASDMSLIRSFSQEAGKGNADVLIRKEISNSKPDYVGSKQISDGELKTSNIAFLTCDLMNSLAAIAEDLNTIYFYRLEDSRLEDSRQLIPIFHDRLAWLVFNTAIHFEECDDHSGEGK
jgi:hypothetical protein